MTTFLTIVHIITVVLMVLVILLQSGKGAEIGASFGGSSQTVFGTSGGTNFFQKFTYGAAAVMMLTSLGLTWYSKHEKKSVFEGVNIPQEASTTNIPPASNAPAAPAAPATSGK